MRRSPQLFFSLLAAVVLLLATGATTSAHQTRTTFMKVKLAHTQRPHHTSNLFYHGGAIEPSAQVYIVYWGQQWASGFSTGGYTSAQAQTYVEDFFGGVGGSSWANSTTQYCQGVANGTTQCGSAGVHPTNPNNELAGTWTDNSSVPATPTQTQIANEAAASTPTRTTWSSRRPATPRTALAQAGAPTTARAATSPTPTCPTSPTRARPAA